MSLVFLKVLNMSIGTGVLVLVIIIIRQLFRWISKNFIIILWALVVFKLICPFSIMNSMSPLPKEYVAGYITDTSFSDGSATDNIVETDGIVTSDTVKVKVSLIEKTVNTISFVWIIGIALSLVKAICKVRTLKHAVRDSVTYRDNIYLNSKINSSFILGIFSPKIYCPSNLDSNSLICIVDHETEHISHYDQLLKLIFFVAATVHWFNPLCYISYKLFCEDLEMACDERTVKNKDAEYKAKYLQTLLDNGCYSADLVNGVLPFGGVCVKRRIERIMTNKKTDTVSVIAFILVFAGLVFFFMTSNASAFSGFIKDSEVNDGLHLVIRDSSGNIVESIASDHPDALLPPESDSEITDSNQKDNLLSIKEEVLKKGAISYTASKGEAVLSVCEGRVIASKYEPNYGYCVTVLDNEGHSWKYGHCSKLLSKEGDIVAFGDLIALAGSSGLTEDVRVLIKIN